MKILIFGNPLLENDSLPIKLIPKLKQQFPEHDFLEIDPTENIEQYMDEEKTLTIIDAVEGITNTILITNIDQLQTNKLYSMHDFDLGYNLKLLKKVGKINGIRVIGLPMDINEEAAMSYIQLILRK